MLILASITAAAAKLESSKLEATHAYETADSHNIEALTVTFDSDAVTFVLDNSATGHICNDKLLFEGELLEDSSSGVVTANGVSNHMQGNIPPLVLETLRAPSMARVP